MNNSSCSSRFAPFANPLSHGRSGTFNAEVRLPRSKFLASLYDTALTVLMSEPMLSSPYRASNSKVRNFDERPRAEST